MWTVTDFLGPGLWQGPPIFFSVSWYLYGGGPERGLGLQNGCHLLHVYNLKLELHQSLVTTAAASLFPGSFGWDCRWQGRLCRVPWCLASSGFGLLPTHRTWLSCYRVVLVLFRASSNHSVAMHPRNQNPLNACHTKGWLPIPFWIPRHL